MTIGQVFASLLVVVMLLRLGQLLVQSGHASMPGVNPDS